MLNPSIFKELADSASKGKWEKAWLLGQWSYEVSHSIKTNSLEFGSLLTRLSQIFIPNQLWKGQEIPDIAGAILLDGNTTPICLQVSGQMRINDSEWEDFKYSLRTPFSEFKGVHHIIHHGEEEKSGSLPGFVSGNKLGKLIPLKITSFSIGLQYYESRHTIFLGYNPTPIATIQFVAKDSVLNFKFTLEQQKSRDDALIERHPAISTLKH